MNLRKLLTATTVTAAGTSLLTAQEAKTPASDATEKVQSTSDRRLLLSLKCGMA